jgi:hypothetical protein
MQNIQSPEAGLRRLSRIPFGSQDDILPHNLGQAFSMRSGVMCHEEKLILTPMASKLSPPSLRGWINGLGGFGV